MIAALLTLNLVSCIHQDDEASSRNVYDLCVSVPANGWSSQDTLFFPVDITASPAVRTPILRQTDYPVSCSIRMTDSYPYRSLPMMLIVQQTDTVGSSHGEQRVKRNLLRRSIAPMLRDEDGRPLGDSWGSLIQYECPLDSLTLSFDSVGTYRMLIIPSTSGDAQLHGIVSIGLSF